MSVITLEHLSKQFQIGFNADRTMLSRIFGALSGKEKRKPFWALKDVSFTVKAGEIVGIVGPNGAGKSTLLSVIAGIYKKYEGTIHVEGRVISVIGLVNGLKDRLTMHENIYICTALYGLTKEETKRIENDIVKFSGLTGYEMTKLFQFSTGMIARLIFSISVHVKPSILLLDEITSNLDQEFIAIVKKKVRDLTRNGAAVCIVSHRKEIIAECDRAVYIDRGRLLRVGSSKEIIDTYF